jgi:hypothetical protein
MREARVKLQRGILEELCPEQGSALVGNDQVVAPPPASPPIPAVRPLAAIRPLETIAIRMTIDRPRTLSGP